MATARPALRFRPFFVAGLGLFSRPRMTAATGAQRRMAKPRTLFDKIWDSHVVHQDADGTAVLYIDRHLVHEVTSPQAFEGLELAGRKVWRLSANLAVSDHNVPTTDRSGGIADPISRLQAALTGRGGLGEGMFLSLLGHTDQLETSPLRIEG